MPFKLTIADADDHYQDYEYAMALANFFEAVDRVNDGTFVQLQYEADLC
jgi:hypothetical protein